MGFNCAAWLQASSLGALVIPAYRVYPVLPRTPPGKEPDSRQIWLSHCDFAAQQPKPQSCLVKENLLRFHRFSA